MSQYLYLAVALIDILFVNSLQAVEEMKALKQKPNVIFILADDQRADELGCMGDAIIKTPNIDKLASDGVLFTNSFATSASCMPNRTCLLTGQWERCHGIGWNSNSALSGEQWAKTFPMVLKHNGYVTAYVGKNHTRGLRHWDFDYYYGSLNDHLGFYPKARHSVFKNSTFDTQIEILGEAANNFLEESQSFIEGMGENAKLLIKKRDEEKPFFLYLCFNLPHGASTLEMKQLQSDDEIYRSAYRDKKSLIYPPIGYLPKVDPLNPKIPFDVYNGKQISQYDYRFNLDTLREQKLRVYQTISGIDRIVGQVQDKINKLGIQDNTVIIYSSDNGLLHGEYGYGGKCLLYEPSIRVPLIMMDPRMKRSRKGTRVEDLALSVDVAPTILDLCGIKIPEVMQGKSLYSLMKGNRAEWRQDFFCESLILSQNYPLIQGVRNKEWKYIRYWPNQPVPSDYDEILSMGLNGEKPVFEELFNLGSDPHEKKNLVMDSSVKEQLSTMRKRCIELLRESRGSPLASHPILPSSWLSEAPGKWKEILPLLSNQKPD